MAETTENEEDSRLVRLFARAVPVVADHAFSSAVIRRIRGRQRGRSVILLAAAVSGAVIAVWPASQYALELSAGLTTLAASWHLPTWIGHYQTALSACLLIGGFHLGVRMLER